MEPADGTIDVLVVEDDTDMRELSAEALTAAGFNVLTARDGGDGVDLALAHHPKVILLDINMPVMSGHEVMDRLRNDAWGRHVKVIFLTNFSNPQDVFKAVEQGTEEYLIKAHTSLQEIVQKVRLAIHN